MIFAASHYPWSPCLSSSGRSAFPAFRVPHSVFRVTVSDLSINRYKGVEYEAVEHEAPQVILERLAKLEDEIAEGRKELEGLLG